MSTVTFRHNLGDKARDVISGLTGIITSRAEHLYGCARYWLSPQETKDGMPVNGGWFDEESLEVIEPAVIVAPRYVRVAVAEEKPMRRAGGPTSQPASHTRTSER